MTPPTRVVMRAVTLLEFKVSSQTDLTSLAPPLLTPYPSGFTTSFRTTVLLRPRETSSDAVSPFSVLNSCLYFTENNSENWKRPDLSVCVSVFSSVDRFTSVTCAFFWCLPFAAMTVPLITASCLVEVAPLLGDCVFGISATTRIGMPTDSKVGRMLCQVIRMVTSKVRERRFEREFPTLALRRIMRKRLLGVKLRGEETRRRLKTRLRISVLCRSESPFHPPRSPHNDRC